MNLVTEVLQPEILISEISNLLRDDRHVAIGAASPIPGSAALLAERKWGVTLTLVSLSMVISGTGPYSVVRLITLKDIFGIGGLTLLTTLLSTLALLYWCNPKHRKSIRL